MRHLLVSAICLFVLACSRGDESISPQIPEASFGIFFLEDSSVTSYQALQMDIDQLSLKKIAWLGQDDIQFYDFSSHCIYLNGDKSQFFENDTGDFFVFNPILIDKPFVVVANEERCYVGALHSGLLSTAPMCPYMDELDVGYYPRDVMHISRAWVGEDLRSDSRVRDALISLNLFHGGISVSLTSVSVIDNADTATVEYVYTITNKDQDLLLVIDPVKMGVDVFHYFTNGPVFWGGNALFESTYKKVSPAGTSWEAAWFAQLPVGSSIERTVILKGYPRILAGYYDCNFTFSGPKIDKEARYLSGGRVWLGELSSDTIQIQVL